MTRRRVRELLDAHGLAPSRALGQHFVVDPNTVYKVVRDAGIRPGQLVCEIGPGLGSLTLALRAAGARVVAIEIDAGLVRALGEVVGPDPDVKLIHADALGIDYADLLGEPAVLVANLPYNIATPAVITALRSSLFTSLFVMVQAEVGQRWAARPGQRAYGAVSVKLAALADVRVVARVSRRAFYPVPGVDSLTARLAPKPWQEPVERETVFALVEAGFGQRRKLLRNALASPEWPARQVETALTNAGLDLQARAEQLSLADWCALAAVRR